MNRKTAPKVKDGRVQKKNRHELTTNYWNTRQNTLQIDIESPGKGYKHFLKSGTLFNFMRYFHTGRKLNLSLTQFY